MRPALLVLLLLPSLASAADSVKRWVSELDGGDLPRQLAAVRRLGNSGKKEAVDALLARLDVRRTSPRLSGAEIEALGRLKDPRAMDALLGAWDYLKSAELQLGGELTPALQQLRVQVVEAVGQVGGERGAPLLEEAVLDKDPRVVEKAATGLGDIGDKASLDALIALLARGGNVAQAAFEALGRLNDSRAVSTLQGYLKSEDPMTQVEAAYALALNDKAYVPALTAFMRDEKSDWATRLLAAYDLARLGQRAGLDRLRELSQKGKSAEQARAIEALGKVKHPRALAALIELMEAPDPNTRMLAAVALGHVGGTKAAAALKRLADDHSPTVRGAAHESLWELGEGS